MEHGAGTGEKLVNGNAGSGSEESLGQAVVMGGMEDEERVDEEAARGELAVMENTAAPGGAAEDPRTESFGEEEGIYL